MSVLMQESSRRLAADDDIIVVRNTQPGLTIFEDAELGVSSIRWAAANDPEGGDVLEVPVRVLKNAEFRRNVTRGVFVIEQGVEVLDEATSRVQDEWAARQARADESRASISRPSDRRVAKGKSCIAPRGTDLCGTIALVSEGHPPLCVEHQNLEYLFDQVDGIDGPTWTRRKK